MYITEKGVLSHLLLPIVISAVRNSKTSTGNIRNIINKVNYPWRASRQVESLSWFLLAPHLAIKRIRTGRGEDSGRKNRSPVIPTLHWYWRLQLPGTLNDHPVAGVDQVSLAMITAGLEVDPLLCGSECYTAWWRPSHQNLHSSLPHEGLLLLGAKAITVV